MEISVEWLSEFVEVPAVPQLVERLAAAGMEVEKVIDPAAHVSGVVVGVVEALEPHPEAERLKICKVFDGSARFQVVCGAPNVTAGMKVAFAKVGAKLPGLTITERALRGVQSAGMLCAKDELGLPAGSDEGLWALPENAVLGSNALEHAGVTLTIATAPNRPDLLSHIGVARELAAATGKRLKPAVYRATEKGPEASSTARVLVEDAASCRRYCARTVRNVKVGPSPAWLKSRLEQVGQRSINNVVDATNFVLMELGHPLHAFDLSKIAIEAGVPTVRVRRAAPGEKLELLDGTTRSLDDEDLVIADGERALALAGVMGGKSSEVSAATQNVLLESAWFEPSRVRRTARRHGLRTEASLRFERGADVGIVQKALDRCAQLLVDIASGDVAKGVVEVAQKGEPPREINLRLARVKRILGVELTTEEVVQLLEPLEIRCVSRNEASLRFAPPSFRPDLLREIDLIEELARRRGYDKIPETLPGESGPYFSAPVQRRPEEVTRRTLLASGLTEIVTFGFGSPERYASFLPDGFELVTLKNPLGLEFSAMRTSLLPGLLGALAHNQRHGQKHVRLFEVGTVFHQPKERPSAGDERDRELPRETSHVAVLLFGGRHAGRWYEGGERVDFSDLAGAVEALCEALAPQGGASREPLSDTTILNPSAAARLRVAGRDAGVLGQVHPSLLRAFGVEGPVYAAELALATLAHEPLVLRARPLPRFPGTRRDVAVIAPKDVAAEALRRYIVENAGGKLGRDVVEAVQLFDVYTGKPIPDTHVSLAFAIDYRSRERTLTDAEVAEAFLGLQEGLKSRFGIEVRSAT